MNRKTLLTLVGVAALGGAVVGTLEFAGETLAGITIGSPPPRPSINQFDITAVTLSAGGLDADVQVRSGTTVHRSERISVDPGRCSGLRYDADGNIVRYTRIDASITVAAAFNSFAQTAGNFATRADALAVWLQGGGRLCLPQ